MRRVLRNHQEVAHVWAAQSQSEGKSANMFFDGPSIFSYGRHFEIARFVRPETVLFNERGYSSSTGKHKSITLRAVSHCTVFTVPSFDDHQANAAYYLKTCLEARESIKRARIGISYRLERLQSFLDESFKYICLFKVTGKDARAIRKLHRSNILTVEELKILEERETKWKENEKVKEERARLKWEKENAERAAYYKALQEKQETMRLAYESWKEEIDALNVAAWKAGYDSRLDLFDLPVMLRIKDRDIETSHGAYVPIEDAKILWAKLTASEDLKGFQIGHYTVSGIRNQNLIIGCHTIPLREVAKMACVLNLNVSEVA